VKCVDLLGHELYFILNIHCINHVLDTMGEKKRGCPRKMWMEETGRNGVWFTEDGDSCYQTDR
jgi:hypothetical protein